MKKRSPEEIEKEAMQYQLAMLKNERMKLTEDI